MDTVGAVAEGALETGALTVAVHPIAAIETGSIVGLQATPAVDRVRSAVGGIVTTDTVGVTMVIGGGTRTVMIEKDTMMTGAGVLPVDIAARAEADPDIVIMRCLQTVAGSTARLVNFLMSLRRGEASAGAGAPLMTTAWIVFPHRRKERGGTPVAGVVGGVGAGIEEVVGAGGAPRVAAALRSRRQRDVVEAEVDRGKGIERLYFIILTRVTYGEYSPTLQDLQLGM